MPNEILAPAATAPTDRLTLSATPARGVDPSIPIPSYLCACFADGVEAAAMGHASPPGWCAADEA